MVKIWHHISALLTKVGLHFRPKWVSAAVCSNVVVLLLMIHGLLLLPLFVWHLFCSVSCYVVQSVQSSFFFNHLAE